jgi:hypothetical protein
MRRCDANDRARELARHVGRQHPPRQLAAERKGETDHGVEMRPGHRAEHQDQNNENGAGGKRIAQKRQRRVSAGQTLGHDA